MKNGQTEQNQGVRFDFVCPMAYKGTSGGEVCSWYKTYKFLIFDFYSDLRGSADLTCRTPCFIWFYTVLASLHHLMLRNIL